MIEITENAMVTKTVEADNIYHLHYSRGYKTTVANYTDSELYISNNNNFDGENYIFLPASAVLNDFKPGADSDIYIKPAGTGSICIIRQGG